MNTKIKIKAKNVQELLKMLGGSAGETLCTLELDVEVSKSTIKILDNYCEDWDFVDNKSEPEKKQETCENYTPIHPYSQPDQINGWGDKKEDPEQPQGITYYKSRLGVKDYNSLATLVEAIYRRAKQSPDIKFESSLFYNTLETEYNAVASSPVNVEHSLIAMIIETYYNKATMDEAIEDTVEKLRGLWITKKLSEHPGVTSLTKILYGNGRS